MRDKTLDREISCHLAAKVFMQAVEEGLVVRSLHSMNLVVLHICHSACKRCSKCKIHISIDTPIQNTACCGVSVTNVRFADHMPGDISGCKQRNAGIPATRRREGAEDLHLQEDVVSGLQVDIASSHPSQ